MKHIKEFEAFLNEGKGQQFKNKWNANEYSDMNITGVDNLLNNFMEDNNAFPEDLAFVDVKIQTQSNRMAKELENADIPYIGWRNTDGKVYLVFVVD